ncbi:hypothetical protein Bca52824_028327 [Brassica carinata]|uniref:F-box domain-containing protein n=1 Tax=Brassica carinata TaxID=52824 RepID=A0A8X7VC40_BRACI|nr:hypothetical protein Bca52824_028327 [Brassica carinata]
MSAQRDSISSLPDEVLGKVLSLLPTNEAASTSVLSKRWRNLLPLVDSLDLSDVATGNPRGFSDFVDKTLLALLTNSSSIIKRFILRCEHKHDSSQVDTWIRTVLERRNILELRLESSCNHFIEAESFRSNTLVKLTLSSGFCLTGLPPPPGGLFFPNLKTLSLVLVGFRDCEVYGYLISGCPVLEELFLRYGPPSDFRWMPLRHNIAVLNPSVKRLTITYPSRCYREPPHIQVFRTPSLVYLDYSSYAAGLYHVDLSSLVEARLDLQKERLLYEDEDGNDSGWGEYDYDDDDGSGFDEDHNAIDDNCSYCGDEDDDSVSDEDHDIDEDEYGDGDGLHDVTNLVAGISNVKTLHLSSESLEVFHLYCKSMPVFHKLLTLSFESDKERGWQVVPLLLNNSPNLETLLIKGLVHRVTDICGDACVCIARKKMGEETCCLSTCQVKVLKVLGYGGTNRELNQMKHFFGNLEYLETVKVGVKAENRQEDNSVNKKYQRITNVLTKLPRASSNCQIHFF